MHELQIFNNEEFGQIRTVEIDGEIYFVGKDVTEILGYSNPRKAIIDHVDEEDKTDGVTIRDSIGREQNPVCINESGLYSLILSSKMPNAKKFKRWVTSEILPTLRKTGSYEMPNAKKNKSNRTALSSANMMVKNVMSVLEKAKVEPVFIAAEVKRLYTDLGYEVKAPLVTDKETMSKLYDCTDIAKELGIYSANDNPHNQAVSVIIKKLHIPDSEIITTAFSQNGHDGVTIQYKPSVLDDVKAWLSENNYPARIPYVDSKGNKKACTVMYSNIDR
nr:Bro-N domain-containing protein [uncultured Enterocloster sp.]